MSRIALISGSTGGLGSALAKKMAKEGYRLALHYFQQADEAKALLKEIGGEENYHQIFQADLRNEEEVISMTNSIRYKMGSIELLINNAGIPFSGLSWKQSLENWLEIFSVNTTAAWLLSKHCIPQMRTYEKGRIIYISSIVAHRPLAGTSAYAASKAALEGLTRAQAVELAHFNITVNCIAPGYFDAGMIDSVDAPLQEKIISSTPASRLGHADELAAATIYLCNEEASFTTGQIIHINGGLYI
jgi:3-oxoacyl-[acyl-carrier protein] reductase